MRKLSIALLSILSIFLSCTTTSDRPDSIETTQNIRVASSDNFLRGKKFLYVSYLDNDELKTYLYINPNENNSERTFVYGTYIFFSDSLNYKMYYTAPCGNDCFFSSIGKYSVFEDDLLSFVLDSTVYYGVCGNEPAIYGKGEDLYKMIRINNDSIIELIKID